MGHLPPIADFIQPHEDYWPSPAHQPIKTLRHIGVIVKKTGHDRGQKEMFLYSPTVKRDDGLLVCSSDFLHFEVGEWLLFNVQVYHGKHDEKYIGGKKWRDPIPTGIQFDCPRVRVRAVMYPDTYVSVTSSQQTRRCWSPDLGDLFIDGKTLGEQYNDNYMPIINKFATDLNRLYYVHADYHFNASIFYDQVGGSDRERKVYWRIHTIEGVVDGDECLDDVQDWALIPWRQHVFKYVENRRDKTGEFSNSVPPWYIRSTRVLTHDMIETWEEETKNSLGQPDEKDHPYPILVKDGIMVKAHISEIFAELKNNQKKLEDDTKLLEHTNASQKSNYSWKKVMSFDGEMLEPGSLLPPVSTVRKQRGTDERVELVQDSAGLFMSKAAALSYVEIKENGTDKVWLTGGWKKPGQSWEHDPSMSRWDKNTHELDYFPSRIRDNPSNLIRCATPVPSKKNLLGTLRAPSKKTVEPSKPSPGRCSPPPVLPSPPSVPPVDHRSQVHTDVTLPKLSFASAARMRKDEESPADLSEVESLGSIDYSRLNEEGRQLYEKYTKLKAHVEGCEVEANAKPTIKGFTTRQYIDSQKENIKAIQAVIAFRIREETEEDRETIRECTERINILEMALEENKVMESEMIEIHMTESQDAERKKGLKEYVEIQKKELRKMEEILIDIQNNESTTEENN